MSYSAGSRPIRSQRLRQEGRGAPAFLVLTFAPGSPRGHPLFWELRWQKPIWDSRFWLNLRKGDFLS